MKPSSFCSLSTNSCWNELYGLLLSLSLYHQNTNVYLLVDTLTKENIINAMNKSNSILNLNLNWYVELDIYSNLTRDEMERKGIWTTFQLSKCDIIDHALSNESDTLFLDSDIVVFDEINDINNSKDIGVSPHYIRSRDTDLYGYYNGGVLWTKNKNVTTDWREYTKKSRFFEQAAIEDLALKYNFFSFGINYNVSWWRMFQSNVNYKIIEQDFGYDNKLNKITYGGKPLKFVHTHFSKSYDNKNNAQTYFNKFILELLNKYKNEERNNYSKLINIIASIRNSGKLL
jgi:hypothetical protein